MTQVELAPPDFPIRRRRETYLDKNDTRGSPALKMGERSIRPVPETKARGPPGPGRAGKGEADRCCVTAARAREQLILSLLLSAAITLSVPVLAADAVVADK